MTDDLSPELDDTHRQWLKGANLRRTVFLSGTPKNLSIEPGADKGSRRQKLRPTRRARKPLGSREKSP